MGSKDGLFKGGTLVTGTDNIKVYGSFQDSLKAPIHRWFQYPAGYSYKMVESKISHYGLDDTSWIADPFVGSGTTSLTAKNQRR